MFERKLMVSSILRIRFILQKNDEVNLLFIFRVK